jgi:hypothetical protein
MRRGSEQGRYVVPAKAIDRVLDDDAATGAGAFDAPDWSITWDPTEQEAPGGVA